MARTSAIRRDRHRQDGTADEEPMTTSMDRSPTDENVEIKKHVGESLSQRPQQGTVVPAGGPSTVFRSHLPTTAAALPTTSPNWLKTYERTVGRQWGFVAFKVGTYQDDEWVMYKQRLNEVIRLPFRVDEQAPGVREAADRFQLHWLEDPEYEKADVTQLQNKFAEMAGSLPVGIPTELFFVATPQSVSHLLNAPIPDTGSVRWRPDPPYIVAISATRSAGLEAEHEEAVWFLESFKVAAETIIDELWFVLECLSWPVRKVTRGIRGIRLISGEELPNDEETESIGGTLETVWWSSAPSPETLRRRRLF